mmetsp:Transcript_52128/g.93880  ORF Transcript_52128/g.93880 Transcript_52128/m.93880 type:complete len:223 (+) Transcript_52128:47-715(+)
MAKSGAYLFAYYAVITLQLLTIITTHFLAEKMKSEWTSYNLSSLFTQTKRETVKSLPFAGLVSVATFLDCDAVNRVRASWERHRNMTLHDHLDAVCMHREGEDGKMKYWPPVGLHPEASSSPRRLRAASHDDDFWQEVEPEPTQQQQDVMKVTTQTESTATTTPMGSSSSSSNSSNSSSYCNSSCSTRRTSRRSRLCCSSNRLANLKHRRKALPCRTSSPAA